jgi:hypothetical protein
MISVFNVLFLLYVKKVAGDTDGVKNIIVCELTHPLPPPPLLRKEGEEGGKRIFFTLFPKERGSTSEAMSG